MGHEDAEGDACGRMQGRSSDVETQWAGRKGTEHKTQSHGGKDTVTQRAGQ